jgi:hypothetical protein
VKCRGSADVRRARRGRRLACARRSSAKDSPRAVPQTAVIPIVTRHYTSGLLNFATNSPEDSLASTTEDTVLRAPSGLDGWDRSSTDRRLCASVYAGPRSRAVAEGGSWIDSGSASRAGAVVIEDDSLVR